MTWWFEDARPGATIEHPRGRTITPDEHARLAWLTDNASPVHGDAHRAASGPFRQPLVLGALTVAVVLGLAEPGTARAADAGRAAPRGWSRVALTATVLGGDTLWASSRIEASERDEDGLGGWVRRTIEGRTQAGTLVTSIDEERWIPSRA